MDYQQTDLIKSARKFLSFFNNTNYLPYKNSIFYLPSYSSSIGSYLLSSFSNIKYEGRLNNLATILKDILYSLNYNNHKIYYLKKNFYYDKVIVTWAFENSFNKNGSLQDRYFNINSKDLKKTLWFVIYLSENKPSKVNNNIVLFKPITSKSINIFSILRNLIKNFFFIFKSLKYYLALISNFNYFAEIFLNQISPFLNRNVKFILMPFEAQPFQNRLIHFVKKNFSKIKTIGYIHPPPLAMPSNFIFKNSSPHQIILNGKDQLYCFTKILGWKKSRIKLLPSYRFIKSKKKPKNTIFLPLAIRNIDKILNALRFLSENSYIDIKKLKVKKHPSSLNSKKNMAFSKKMKILAHNTEKKNSIKKNYSIFIGSSGAIIEALERGAKVIQIADFPLFDVYSSKIWPSINSKKIRDDIFVYELKKKGNLIKFGNKKNNLNKIFN